MSKNIQEINLIIIAFENDHHVTLDSEDPIKIKLVNVTESGHYSSDLGALKTEKHAKAALVFTSDDFELYKHDESFKTNLINKENIVNIRFMHSSDADGDYTEYIVDETIYHSL